MRILALEDTYDLEAMLTSAGQTEGTFDLVQRWDSSDALNWISEVDPDVLMLDFFMPPFNGLEVLRRLNKAISDGAMKRPKTIIAISSESEANALLRAEGADAAVIKFDLHTLDFWNQA